MPASYRGHLDIGYARPVRYRRGEAVNVWYSKINEIADRLGTMDMSPELAATLRELFEELGQQAKDAAALV